MNKKGRPRVGELKKNYCVKLRPSTREWYTREKISIGRVLENFKDINCGTETD